MTKICLHIGYPKAASTFLQWNVFRLHSGINNFSDVYVDRLGCEQISKSKEIADFYKPFFQQDSLDYNSQLQATKLHYLLESYSSLDDLCVFSSEDLVLPGAVDIATIANRLWSLFHEFQYLKVLIIIRNQVDLFRSMYDWNPFSPYGLSSSRQWLKVDNWIDSAFEKPHHNFVSSLNYFKIVQHYSKLFGRDKIHILLFEDLIHDKNKFSAKLANVLEVDPSEISFLVNSGGHANSAEMRYMTLLQKAFMGDFKVSTFLSQEARNGLKNRIQPFMKVVKKKTHLSSKNIEKISQYYAQSNKDLADEYGIDLVQYRYCL